MHLLTKTRRRKALTGALTTLLVVAGAAFGYYLIYANGEGSGSAKLGAGTPETLPIKVTFAPGLTPGGMESIAFAVDNTTKSTGEVGKLAWTASSTTPGCEASWFAVSGHGLSGGEAEVSPVVTVLPGEEKTIDAGTNLTFAESGTNQSACESGSVTITAHTTP